MSTLIGRSVLFPGFFSRFEFYEFLSGFNSLEFVLFGIFFRGKVFQTPSSSITFRSNAHGQATMTGIIKGHWSECEFLSQWILTLENRFYGDRVSIKVCGQRRLPRSTTTPTTKEEEDRFKSLSSLPSALSSSGPMDV